ncbi:MAG: nitrogenase iron-molybdenum cofactor biosynthesis protein NifN, partial [Mesorhizobium sp.]
LAILYQGTRDLIFEVANIFQADQHAPTPEALDPLRNREISHERCSPPLAGQ